ncbi:group 1 glycosyl transferase [Candidatus Magnetobacterium bavaricum]|uniref:Group 1 glycosyl transferase n=1 Tax=Candidatus Magnetobacterium bavaricum TaxID=29290 RepID=A0A0F3GU83_9BACT|nr:group 1 glycosyl transferase [Candidatus Magnetobacterium bavaricum]
MKILHLLYESSGDYFGIGGVGRRAYEIYDRLKRRHDVTLLCRSYPHAPKEAEIEGLRHVFVGLKTKSFLKALLGYAWYASSFVRRHGRDYDVIVEEFSPALPTFLDTYRDRPLALQVQGYTGKQYFDKYGISYAAPLYIMERYRVPAYRNLIFVSEAAKARYRLRANCKPTVISNGISEGLLEVKPGRSDYILCLGRIDVHHKGLDVLLGGYAGFCKVFPDVRLVIAGTGRDMGGFSVLVEALPQAVRRNIQCTGWVDGQQKTALLRDALFVVAPSRYETQNIVILEALACAKAVVVSDIPELRYAVDCGAGLSFRSEDASSLAAAMVQLASQGRIEEMGAQGRLWVSDYTWDKVSLSYERYIASL